MIVLVDEGPDTSVRTMYTTAEDRDGPLRVVRLSYRPGTARLAYLAAVVGLTRALGRSGTRVDVLHAHVHRMGWPAVVAGGLLRRPVVITEHSSEWPSRTITRGALLRARVAFRCAALVTPVSRALQEAIESYGVHARFRVVPNAVDTGMFRPPRNPRPGAPTRLVNVALHVEVKALDVLLRAFAELAAENHDLTLELIGDGPLTPELERLADELGVARRVEFRGRAQPAEVADRLRNAHVFVMSSLSENMPLALLEALCTGLPVAATAVGGVPDAVADDGRLAEPGDPASLANAIRGVLKAYERFDREAIAERAAACWSLEAVGRTWDEIYRSL